MAFPQAAAHTAGQEGDAGGGEKQQGKIVRPADLLAQSRQEPDQPLLPRVERRAVHDAEGQGRDHAHGQRIHQAPIAGRLGASVGRGHVGQVGARGGGKTAQGKAVDQTQAEQQADAERPGVQYRPTGKQPDRGGHHQHPAIAVGPAAGKGLDRKRDQARNADQQTDIDFPTTQLPNVERQGREKEKKAGKESQADQAQQDKVTAEDARDQHRHSIQMAGWSLSSM